MLFLPLECQSADSGCMLADGPTGSQSLKGRKNMDTPATPTQQRVELSPAARAILEGDSPQSQLLRHFVRYQKALLADPAGLDNVVTPDGRCHTVEALGLPRGLEGLKMFRHQVNAAIPDEHILITSVRFEGDDIIEADMVMEATQTGEIFGIPPTGRTIRWDVHERCRFVAGKLAERWAQVDFEDIKRKLTGPSQ
jgi:predicted ester cyclase